MGPEALNKPVAYRISKVEIVGDGVDFHLYRSSDSNVCPLAVRKGNSRGGILR